MGGDWKLAAAGGTGERQQAQLTTKLNLFPFFFCIYLFNKNDVPESFVGAGERGGIESFMAAESEHSVDISFGASQSDFLFSEPMVGFI